MNFTESTHCQSRRHCLACRSSRTFRASLAGAFELPEGDVDFACPHGEGEVIGTGMAADQKPCGCSKKKESLGVGDLVAVATTALGFKPCESCKRRQAWFNRFGCRINRWFHRAVNWLVPCGKPAEE